jgi:hypothetical protein
MTRKFGDMFQIFDKKKSIVNLYLYATHDMVAIWPLEFSLPEIKRFGQLTIFLFVFFEN